jgi:membrane-bound lytic murein transglycosylase
MPNWEPNWHDVKWDHGAAAEAAHALESAAASLDESAHRRRQVADQAREEWRGRKREEFDMQLDKMLRRAAELAAEFRAKASEICRADQRAFEEQRRRELERERWRHEKEMEERQSLLRQQGLL